MYEQHDTTTTVLMVCTEYPPMKGATGAYAANLTRALKRNGMNVYIACNESGKGDFYGLSPTNKQNSEILLKIVDELKPDIVHIQFEAGLYGLTLDPKDSTKSGTFIDSFYIKCKTPIVTTFHSLFSLTEWMKMNNVNQALLVKREGKMGKVGVPLRMLIRWTRWMKYNRENISKYQFFKNLTIVKVRQSRASIVFSRHMSKMLNETAKVIYIGSDPAISFPVSKKEARMKLSLPQDRRRIALAIGFRTVNKGWDIIEKMNIPDEWMIVVNSDKDHYNTQNLNFKWEEEVNNNQRYHNNIIDLQRGFLADEDFSTLLYAADAVILPYKVAAASAIMFNALGHGIPFVATDLEFFREFSKQGLGIIVKRKPDDFTKGLKILSQNYVKYKEAVDAFKHSLRWDYIARQYISIYNSLAVKPSIKAEITE
jgi:glycosyltransferase involved in cell wall biosynthesis